MTDTIVLPRQESTESQDSFVFPKKSVKSFESFAFQKQTLSADVTGQYQFDSQLMAKGQPIAIYDGEEKLAEITDYFGTTTLKVLTTKPFHVFGHFDTQALHVQSTGKLIFHDPVRANYLDVHAKEVHFQQPIHCTVGANLKVDEALVCDEKLNVGYMNISAGSVQMKKAIKARDEVTIATQKDTRLEDEITSRQSMTVKATNVVLVKDVRAKELNVEASNIVNAKGNIKTSKSIKMKASQVSQHGKWHTKENCEITDCRKFYSNKTASLDVENRFVFRGDTCALYGATHVEQGCDIDASWLVTANKMQWSGAHNIRSKKWDCNTGSQVALIHTATDQLSHINLQGVFASEKDSSIAISTTLKPEELTKMGQFPVTFHAAETRVTGKFDLHNAHFSSDLWVMHPAAASEISRSSLAVKNSVIDGKLSCQNSSVEMEDMSHSATSQANYQNIHFKQNTKKISDNLRTNGKCTFKQVIMEANVDLCGQLDVEQIAVKGKDVTLQPESLHGKQITIDSDLLVLAANKGKTPEFKELIAKTQMLEIRDIILTDSHLVAEGNKVQENLGKLLLKNSTIHSDGQIYNDAKAQLKTVSHDSKNTSGIKARCFNNAGEVALNSSTLTTDVLMHVGKNFEALQSTVAVQTNLFIDNEAKLNLSQGHLDAKQASVLVRKGELNAQKQSGIASKSITVARDAKLSVEQSSSADAGEELLQLGECKVVDSALSAKKLDVLGKYDASRAEIKADEMDVLSEAKIAESKLIVKDKILFRPDAKVRLEDSKVKTGLLDHQGYLYVKKTVPVNKDKNAADEQKKDDKPKSDPTLKLDRFLTSYGSRIEGDNLDIEVGDWKHLGDLSVTGTLKAEGTSLWNEGRIKSATKADLGFNYFANVGGYVSATEHLKVKSAVSANLFGALHSHTLETTSFVDLNMGVISAWNSQRNSLVSLDCGLSLPSFDPAQIFSVDGVKRFAKQSLRTALNTVVPELSTITNLAYSLPGLYSSGQKVLEGRSIEKLKNARLYEFAELTCDIANFAVAAHQVAKEISSSLPQDKSQDKEKDPKESTEKSAGGVAEKEKTPQEGNTPQKQNVSEPTFASRAAEAPLAFFGPKQTTQSVLRANYGVNASHSINETSLYSHNGGVQYATGSATINASNLSNSGYIAAATGAVNLSGDTFANHGTVTGGSGVNAKFTQVNLSKDSQQNYSHWKIASSQLDIEGGHSFEKSQIQTKTLNATKSAADDKLEFKDHSQVSAEVANLSVNTNLNQSSMKCESLRQNDELKVVDHSVLQVDQQHTVAGSAHLTVAQYSHAVLGAQKIEKGGSATIQDHSSQEVKGEWNVAGSASAKNHSELRAKTLEQTGQVKVEDNSQQILAGHHQLNQGADFTVDTNSSAHTETQTIASGAEVHVNNHSSQHVKKAWVIENGGTATASKNVKQNDKTVEITGGFFADSLHSAGGMRLYESYATVNGHAELTNQSTHSVVNGGVKATTIHDAGKLNYGGNCSFEASHYHHSGHIGVESGAADRNVLYVKAATAQLNGGGELACAVYEVDHLQGDEKDFILGRGDYQRYQIAEGLTFVTPDALHLSGQNNRACDLSISAKDIVSNVAFQGDYDVRLQSTVGDITLQQNANVRNFTVVSAQDIHNYADLVAKQKMLMHAGGSIDNNGKTILGGKYCQLTADKDIFNRCLESSYQGKHDIMKRYQAAVIAGGSEGVYIEAGGRVVNDASTIEGIGNVEVYGKLSVECLARSHTYISDKYKRSGFLGFNKEKGFNTSTQFQGSRICSQTGKNTIDSEAGSVHAVGTQFLSAKGTNITAEQNVQLFNLKTEGKSYKEKSSWWGLSHDKKISRYQEAIPVVVLDNGASKIHAKRGDVDARGTMFIGGGDLHIKAGNNIRLSREKLDHSSSHKSQSLSVSFMGVQALDTAKSGGNLWQMAMAEDPTLAKINALANSKDATAAIANAANLGIDAFNTANSIAAGLNNDTLGGTLMQRYGVGSTQGGVNPAVTVGLTRNSTKTHSQTLGPGGIDRGNVTLEAGNKLSLENGIEVQARGNATVRAKQVEMTAAELAFSSKTKSTSVKVGVTASGSVTNVGVGHAKSEQASTTHINSALRAGGKLDIQTDELTLKGANIEAKSIEGNIKKCTIESQQDKSRSSHMSVEANTSGMISVSKHKQSSAKVNQVSGIHIHDGINQEQKTFSIDHLHQKGGSVTSDGRVGQFVNKTTAEDVHDYHRESGVSVAMNAKDLTRLVPGQENSTKPNHHQTPIATATIGIDSVQSKTIVHSTIHGQRGTELPLQAEGFINTSSMDGRQVIQNSSTHVRIDVPITTREHLSQASDNLAQAGARFFPASVQPVVMPQGSGNAPVPPADDLPPPLVSAEEGGDKAERPALSASDKSVKPESATETPGAELATADPKSNSHSKSTPFKMKTCDVRVGAKKGRAGKQATDIDDGRYTNAKNVANKIAAKNEQRPAVAHSTKVATKKVELHAGESQTLWESASQLGNQNHRIKPAIVDDGGRVTLHAEYDPNSGLANAQFEAGRSIDANIAQGEQQLYGSGQVQYSVSAARTAALFNASVSNQRGIKAEARAEVGVMGPNASASVRTPEFCFFGFTFQGEAQARAGIGAKAAAGAGITLDKTSANIRPYMTVGGYLGAGAETELSMKVGIDGEYYQRVSREFHNVANHPDNVRMSEELNRCITEAQNKTPDTYLESLWNAYSEDCWRESQQDHAERMYREAIINTGPGFRVK